jgi:hypothetical protein
MAVSYVKKIRILRFLFITTSLLLMACAVATPLLLESRLLPMEKLVLDEDLLESILIAVLVSISAAVYALYRRELRSLRRQLASISDTNTALRERLTDAFRYIGTVNVQLHEIHSVFAKIIRYPESRREFKRLLAQISTEVLSAVDKDWMLIRIVSRVNLKTCMESWSTRPNRLPPAVCISNRAAMGANAPAHVEVIRSQRANSAAAVIFVFPLPRLSREDRILTEAVAAEIEMIYTVYTSRAVSNNPSEVF